MSTEKQAVAVNRAPQPIDLFRVESDRMSVEIKAALPPHVTVEKFMRVVMTAVQDNPFLLTLDRKSLWSSCLNAAKDGLIPDKREAALVPFKNQVQYLPMIAGILKKVRQSGELSSITSAIIFKNDKFRFWTDGTGEHLEHEPLLFGERGDPIGVYGLATTKDGGVYIEVMTKEQVMDVRGMSQAKNGPWDGPFASEMWRKTVIRRLSKRLPMSTDLEQVLRRDDEIYDLKHTADTSKAAALTALIAAPQAVAPEPESFDSAPSGPMVQQTDERLVK